LGVSSDLRHQGNKWDGGKTRMDLLPVELMTAVGTILTGGAKKYGDRNWEKGLEWSRVYAATLRHLFAWWSGEDKDPESGHSHLWHVATNIAFLIAYEARGTGKDDRPCPRPFLPENAITAELKRQALYSRQVDGTATTAGETGSA
jgi:hypothetical protein